MYCDLNISDALLFISYNFFSLFPKISGNSVVGYIII